MSRRRPMSLGIFALTAAGLAAFVALGGTSHLLHLESIDPTSGRDIFVVFALGALLTIVRSTTTTIYTATGDFAYAVAINAIFLTINTLASLGAVLLGAG